VKVTARARRSGDWWAIDVPEVAGAFTQAKRLDQVPAEVADAVATLLEVPVSTVELERIEIIFGNAETTRTLNEVIRTARSLAEEAERIQREASAAMREAVDVLRGLGFTVRDVGTMLGVSHQRVGQLAETSDKAPAKKGSAKKVPPKPRITPHPHLSSDGVRLKLPPAERFPTKQAAAKAAVAKAKARGARPSATRKPK
jgi:hypothetical protein